MDWLQTAKRTPKYAIPICRKLFSRHDIKLKSEQLLKWANEKQEMKL